ncbi:C4-dicarboxylate TRAP transporter substrate-binding protein [Pseudooceanicola sp.]|uniref:C4-dicarboxylate TRAP transporter substrate-binding protein n=1 Tax=Pseudooceanicola sp. TaxID=1914328 RepID=UPI0035C761C7
MTTRIASAAAIAAGIALAATSVGARELTYGNYTSPTHTTYVNGALPAMERITEQTNGEITFETFTGGAMGGPKELLGNASNNILDIVSVVDIYVKAALPVSAMLSGMIVVGEDPKVMAAAMNEMQLLRCPECKEERDRNNVVGLSWSATASYHVICKDPISGLADLQGTKIRATSSVGRGMQDIGAAPVSITTAEMYEAMQRGQIDCAAGSTAWLKTYNLKDFAKMAWSNSLGSYFGTMNFTMNKDVWEEDLTDEQRQVFHDNMAEAVADVMWAYVADGEEGMQWLRDNGGTVVEADDAFKEAWAKVQAGTVAETIEAGKEGGIENAEEIVNTFMGLVDKWTKIVEEVGDDKDAYRQKLQEEIFSKI